jgi:IclR family transcriptional regulator, acetate operon repressor
VNKTAREPTRIRSVAKAVAILQHLAAAPAPQTAREVAEALGMPVATTYHLLDTLVAERMLVKDSRRLYHLGPGVSALATALHRRSAPPPYLLGPLRRLAEATRETAYLSAPQGDDVVLLHAIEGSHAVLVRSLTPGFRGNAHARASGKAVLAHRADMLERLLARGPLPALTANTITDEPRLREELDEVRVRGYAVDREEFTPGVSGVSAPVLERGAAIASYTVATPTARFVERRDELVAAVLAAARDEL